MNRKLIKDLSASAFQVFFNQFLGLLIFILTSRFLAKDVYGEMNWSLAVLTFVTAILSLRLEQVVVRRIAAGHDASKLLMLFTGHVLVAGILFYAGLLLCSLAFPLFFKKHDLLLILAISHLLLFFSSPFKQLANGKQAFRILAVMSSVANFIRAFCLLLIVLYTTLTIEAVLTIYIVSSCAELAMGIILTKYYLKISSSFRHNLNDYFLLIRNSLPLAGAVVLNASIARIDWILLGILATAEQTAEYSFAYKVFELSPSPLLIIAPILLTRFSKFLSEHSEMDLLRNKKKDLNLLIRIEMLVATFIPLLLNIIWTPLIDNLTKNKYGAVNESTFFLLSCCIPFLYLNNILWSVFMAQNRLKLIFHITLVTFIIVVTGDLILIPIYAAKGAAFVYLIATIVEYVNYMRHSSLSAIKETWRSPLICMMSAALTGLFTVNFTSSLFIRLCIGIPLFCFFILATKQIQKSDIAYIRHRFRKKEFSD